MYNMHPYFSLKNVGKINAHYTQQNTVENICAAIFCTHKMLYVHAILSIYPVLVEYLLSSGTIPGTKVRATHKIYHALHVTELLF